MANLYVTEFSGLEVGAFPYPVQPPLAEQKVAFTGTAAASSAFNAGTRLVRLNSDAACSISIGTNPTATANTARLSLGITEYFVVQPGHKVSAITNT